MTLDVWKVITAKEYTAQKKAKGKEKHSSDTK